MEFIRSLIKLRPQHRGCVATIGNFDGVHIGHQALLRQLITRAQTAHLPATVLLFEPQPQEFFNPTTAPVRLTRLREKLPLIAELKIDRTLCIRFNTEFSQLTASQFIQDILIQRLNIQHLTIGPDFRFGQAQQGNFNTLQTAGQHFNFTTEVSDTILIDGERVSSTRLRHALALGDLTTAHRLLGRAYHLWGRVSPGQQRGRTLGFPTANVPLHRPSSPLSGVFAVQVHLPNLTKTALPGIANLGIRPTIGGKQPLLEVHLFDFHTSIYHQPIQVTFLQKIRDEQHFPSLYALQHQIQQDVHLAKSLLTL